MAYRYTTWKLCEGTIGKYFGDESLATVMEGGLAIGRQNARPFLSAVLKRVQPQVSEMTRLFLSRHPEYGTHSLNSLFNRIASSPAAPRNDILIQKIRSTAHSTVL
jgi:hypothetical protein